MLIFLLNFLQNVVSTQFIYKQFQQAEVEDPVSLMCEKSILGSTLFTKLVPFAVHKAHIVYSNRKDNCVKTLCQRCLI